MSTNGLGVVTYKRHPASQVWPDLTEEEFLALKESISKVGVQDDILVMGDGMVVDGWHRLRACNDLKIQPKVKKIKDLSQEGVCDLILGLHKGRRHLSKEEMAFATIEMMKACGLKLSSQQGGRPRKNNRNPSITAEKVAEVAGVSHSTAKRAISQERSKESPSTGKKDTRGPAPQKKPPATKSRVKELEKEVLLKEEEASSLRESVNEMKKAVDDGDRSHLVQTIERLKAANESLEKQVNEWMAKHAHQETIIKAQKAYIKKLEKESQQEDPDDLDFNEDQADFDDF